LKAIVSITLATVCAVALVRAVPPAPPSIADLTKRSDVVAIVTITNVTDHVSTKVAWEKGSRQSAIAVVGRTLKGTVPRVMQLTFEGDPLKISCRAPNLSTGQFLVFLRRQGDSYTRTDAWYGQANIVTNHVSLPLEHPIPLETAVREIERTVGSQQPR
jgi:hypothetical protein